MDKSLEIFDPPSSPLVDSFIKKNPLVWPRSFWTQPDLTFSENLVFYLIDCAVDDLLKALEAYQV